MVFRFNLKNNNNLAIYLGVLIVCGPIGHVAASNIHQPPGPNLTLGSVVHGVTVSAAVANPAAPAAEHKNTRGDRGAGLLIGGGLEYGNVDEIFNIINLVSSTIQDADREPPDEIPPNLPEEPVQLPTNLTWQDVVNSNPEYQQWFDALQAQSVFIASTLAVVSQQAYAKAMVSADLPVVISHELWGGSLVFSAGSSATSKAKGIVDVFEFDVEQALSQIDAARMLPPDAAETTFNLSDDIHLIVDPSKGSVNVKVVNDSLLLTKAAIAHTFALGYSREAYAIEQGSFFWGVKPKFYRIGLTQVDTRLGDLSDAEALFNDIKDADFRYASRLSVDFGALWRTDTYSLGLTLSDPFRPSFNFPSVEKSKYSKRDIYFRIQKESTYFIDPQLRFEASLLPKYSPWSFNLEFDANAIRDPMGDEYQWLVASTVYTSEKKWMPDFRLGYRSNLDGSDLEYYSVGASFFDVFSVDLASTRDKVKISGENIPRGMNISLGLNLQF